MRLFALGLALCLTIGGAACFSFAPTLGQASRLGVPSHARVSIAQRRREGVALQMGMPRGKISTGNKFTSLKLASVLETINIQEFDTQGQDQLCPQELRAALRSKKVSLTEYQFMGLLRELDKNVDGYICKADIDATIRDIRETFDSPSLVKASGTAAREARDKFFENIAGRTDAWRENSRRYSRTVFEASDWLKYRRSTRLIEMVLSTFNSGVLRALWFDIAVVVTLCSALLLYNHGIEDGYLLQALSGTPEPVQEAAKQLPVAKLPLSPFTISSPALGLLLVFRTNGAFQRFFEARALWGALINYSRTMTRQALYYMDDPRYIEETCRRTIVFARALKLHMRYEADKDRVAMKEFTGLIGKEEAEKLMAATHRPCQALTDLASVVRRAPNLDSTARRSFDVTMENFSNQLGACERIFKTPLPLLYTRHTARFLTLWVLTLPLAMYTELKGSLMLIPIMAVIAAFKLGIEELGVQITEPFSVLPLENMCDGIEASCTEMIKRGTEKAMTQESYAFFAGSDANQILSQAVLGFPQEDKSFVAEIIDGSEDFELMADEGAPCSVLVGLDSESYPMMDKEAMMRMARKNVDRYSSTYEDSWRLGMGGFGISGSESGDTDDEEGCLI
mmetsp:Transcript_64940/g.159907  ORF Transcript_64940/g.159907 Transcript_64940/m.159907 type:complete len:624 (+) Transcript_64940:167-2038(+)